MSIFNTPGEGIENQDGIEETDAEALGSLFLNEEEPEGDKPSTDDPESENGRNDGPEAGDEDGEPGEDDADEDDEQDLEPVTAADEAVVTLSDGTQTTVGELKRGNLRESDYTRKSQELAQQRREFEETSSRTSQLEEQLATERQLMATALQGVMPQAPDPALMETDPVAYMQAKEQFEQHQNAVRQTQDLQQQAQQRAQAEQAQNQQDYLVKERQALLDAMPEFKDQNAYSNFWNSAQTYLRQQGFTTDEISTVADHRFYKVMKDALSYRALLAKKSTAKQKGEGKPAVMTTKTRKGNRGRADKAVADRINRAQQSGNVESVADILGQFFE